MSIKSEREEIEGVLSVSKDVEYYVCMQHVFIKFEVVKPPPRSPTLEPRDGMKSTDVAPLLNNTI